MMRTTLRWLVKGLLPVLVIGGAAWTVWMLYHTRPKAQREEPDPPVPVVSVMPLEAGEHRVTIEAYGTVIPASRVTLQAQVSGRIIAHHAALVPGGVLEGGGEVIRIDPTDYELRVKQEEVALESANAAYELERGQQVVAAKEWSLLRDEIEAPQEMEDFAQRKPQQRQAEAEVEAARNRLAVAKLDLERTVLRAPFNALVLEESVDLGQLISPQARVAELVGTDRFWVQVSVPFELLDRIRFSQGEEGAGSAARVLVNPDLETGASKPARVERLLGDLSDRGRMARILVSIDDPLNLSPDADPAARPVLLNSYVRVDIDGGTLTDVVEIPRVALRENRQVWVRDATGQLQIREVNVRWRRRDTVLVGNHFDPQEQLITSRLAVVIPGMKVRVGTLPGAGPGTGRLQSAEAPAAPKRNGEAPPS